MEDFRQLIQEYQENGSEDILKHILNIVDNVDLLECVESREGEMGNQTVTLKPDLPPLYYLAYRIKAYESRLARYSKHERAGSYDERTFMDDIQKIFTENNLVTEEEIKDYLGSRYSIYKHNRKHMAEVDKAVEVKRLEIIEELRPFITDALKTAIQRVDLTKTDKEIITFISKTFKGIFWRGQAKRNDLIQKGTKVRYWATRSDIKSRVDICEHLFGYTHLSGAKKYLNKNQWKLLNDIIALIDEDIKDDNCQFYNNSGLPIMRKWAERFGLNEDAFKHKIIRIRKIVKENKMDIFQEILNSTKSKRHTTSYI